MSMLVLSRKKNESLVINRDITITVVEIRGDKVRLGIVSPKDVPVHRQEVWEAIHGTAAPQFDQPRLNPLEQEIAKLTRQLEGQAEPSIDLQRLLAAKKLQLAAERNTGGCLS